VVVLGGMLYSSKVCALITVPDSLSAWSLDSSRDFISPKLGIWYVFQNCKNYQNVLKMYILKKEGKKLEFISVSTLANSLI